MIQIAHYETGPLIITDELKAKFLSIHNEEEASSFRGPLLLGLDSANCETIKRIVTARDQQVIIAIKNKQDFKLVPELKFLFPKIFGFIDLSAESEIAMPLLRNYINLNFTR